MARAPIPLEPRRVGAGRRAGRLVLGLVVGACLAVATPGAAQVPTPAPRPADSMSQTPADTLPPLARPVKPLGAFFMSLAVPGWGQARLDRKLTGALFVAWEGISLGMTMKTIRELNYLTRIQADSARLDDKRKQRQDWLILLGFNHLFSGLEAFVSSQLHEFPADVRFRALPGGIGTEVSVPFRIR